MQGHLDAQPCLSAEPAVQIQMFSQIKVQQFKAAFIGHKREEELVWLKTTRVHSALLKTSFIFICAWRLPTLPSWRGPSSYERISKTPFLSPHHICPPPPVLWVGTSSARRREDWRWWSGAIGGAHCQSCDSCMRFHMLWWVIPPSPLHHHVVHGPESSSTLSLTPSLPPPTTVWEEDSSFLRQRPSQRETQKNSLPPMTHSPKSRASHQPLSSHDGPPNHTQAWIAGLPNPPFHPFCRPLFLSFITAVPPCLFAFTLLFLRLFWISKLCYSKEMTKHLRGAHWPPRLHVKLMTRAENNIKEEDVC